MQTAFIVVVTVTSLLVAIACAFMSFRFHQDAPGGGDFGSVISNVLAVVMAIVSFVLALIGIGGIASLFWGGR